MGEISQGMILAVNNKKKLILSGFDKEIPVAWVTRSSDQ